MLPVLRRSLLRPSLAAKLCLFTSFRGCRNASSKANNPNNPTDLPPKPKPKASTSLRRSASDAFPIRSSKPGELKTVFTLATAERFLLSKLRNHPDLPSRSQTLHESWWVPKWGKPGREGEVFVFSNGTFVCWGLEEKDALRFQEEVLGCAPGLSVGALRESEEEELEFVVDSSEVTRLQGDVIILGQPLELSDSTVFPSHLPPMAFPSETLLARYAFSQSLSRSTALSALEVSLDDYLSSMALLPHSLQQTGKPGMGRTALIKKLGELMKFRQGLNLNRENFSDVPDFYWEEPALEKLFSSLNGALEVKQRTNSVNDKITYAVEVQSILRQLLTESSSHRMELVIIALIAVEVIIAIIREGPELRHKLMGSEDEHKI